jgi:hypothetical protein
MYTSKQTARIVGALFLIAMAASLVGAGFLETVLTAPGFPGNISANKTQVVVGALLELFNGIAVIGIAVMMFPIFKKQDEGLALGYVALRIIEAVILIAAVISPLTLIVLSQEYLSAGSAGTSNFQTVSTSFLAVRSLLVGSMTGIFFSLAALLFYYLLYLSKLIPRFISVWGLIGVVLVLTWNLLETFGISVSVGMVLALPIILNEIFLAIWLIVKGFNSPAISSESAETDVKVE